MIAHYCASLGIKGFGPTIITQALELGLLRDPSDLYSLTAQRLCFLDRVGLRKARYLVDQIQSHKQVTYPDFLCALGIPGLDRRVAHILQKRFISLREMRNASQGDIYGCKGIGLKASHSIANGLAEKSDLIDRLLLHVSFTFVLDVPTKRLQDKVFIFTGELHSMPRREAISRVNELGGITHGRVSGHTHYVVIAGKSLHRSSRKTKTALNLIDASVPLQLIDEQQFLDLVA